MLERMRPIAEKHNLTLAQLVIAWTAVQPGLTHVLAGARNAQQAQENAVAGNAILSLKELENITDCISSSELVTHN